MAKNKLSDLRNHLFETIEMLKNNNDPEASANEKIDLDTARQIASASSNIIESYKTEILAVATIAKIDDANKAHAYFQNSGLLESKNESNEN